MTFQHWIYLAGFVVLLSSTIQAAPTQDLHMLLQAIDHVEGGAAATIRDLAHHHPPSAPSSSGVKAPPSLAAGPQQPSETRLIVSPSTGVAMHPSSPSVKAPPSLAVTHTNPVNVKPSGPPADKGKAPLINDARRTQRDDKAETPAITSTDTSNHRRRGPKRKYESVEARTLAAQQRRKEKWAQRSQQEQAEVKKKWAQTSSNRGVEVTEWLDVKREKLRADGISEEQYMKRYGFQPNPKDTNARSRGKRKRMWWAARMTVEKRAAKGKAPTDGSQGS